jgi:hypothetical protein
MKKETSSDNVYKQIAIIRKNPDNIRSLTVNDLIISHDANTFYLTFSLIEPPIVFNSTDLEEIENVDALTRSKLVITPAVLEVMVKTMSDNLENYRKEIEPYEKKG